MVAARVTDPVGDISRHGLALVRSSRQRAGVAIDPSFALCRHEFDTRVSSAQEPDSPRTPNPRRTSIGKITRATFFMK